MCKRKHSCMECEHFRHSEEVFDGHDVEDFGGIVIKTPRYKKLPVRCVLHNERFQAWWEANKNTPSTECVAPEECFELSESLKPLEEMINLAESILASTKDKEWQQGKGKR